MPLPCYERESSAVAVVGWQVGTAEEARAAVEAGCDYVVVQGVEAGGHLRGADSLDVVLAAVLDGVRVPVVAAGGIATPERVADVLGRGADGVRARDGVRPGAKRAGASAQRQTEPAAEMAGVGAETNQSE